MIFGRGQSMKCNTLSNSLTPLAQRNPTYYTHLAKGENCSGVRAGLAGSSLSM